MCRSVRYLLLRHDAVDFCRKNTLMLDLFKTSDQILHETPRRVFLLLPVKMFLNASSTFVESSAEVSINERVFFSEEGGEEM